MFEEFYELFDFRKHDLYAAGNHFFPRTDDVYHKIVRKVYASVMQDGRQHMIEYFKAKRFIFHDDYHTICFRSLVKHDILGINGHFDKFQKLVNDEVFVTSRGEKALKMWETLRPIFELWNIIRTSKWTSIEELELFLALEGKSYLLGQENANLVTEICKAPEDMKLCCIASTVSGILRAKYLDLPSHWKLPSGIKIPKD